MPRPLSALLLAAALAALPAASPALAQSASNPGVVSLADLPSKPSIAPADERTIEAYIASQAPGLTGDDAAVKSARDMLIRPFAAVGISPDFRRAYAKALGPVLARALESPKDIHRANALRVAGETAANTLVETLITGTRDKSSSVRYAAAFGAARLFEAAGRSDPAVTPQRMGDLVAALNALIKSEADPLVLDGAALGIKAALDLDPDTIRDAAWAFRNATLVAFTTALANRVAALPTEDKPAAKLPVVLRGLLATREMVQIMVSKAGGFPSEPKTAIHNACKTILAAHPALAKAAGPAAAEQVAAIKAATETIQKLTPQ